MEFLLYGFLALCYLPIIVLILTPDNPQSFSRNAFILALIYSPVLIVGQFEIVAIIYMLVIIGPALLAKFTSIKLEQRYKTRRSIRLLVSLLGLLGPILYWNLKGEIDNLLVLLGLK